MTRRPSGALILTIGYGAGLATGLSRFPDPAFVIVVLITLALVLHREWWVFALVSGATGIAVGNHARLAASIECAARLPAGPVRLRVHVVDPGQGTGRVAVAGSRCDGLLNARWPMRGPMTPAGVDAQVTGAWTPGRRMLGRPDGILQVDSVRITAARPELVDRWRNGLVRTANRRFGALGAVAIAMLTGARGGLDAPLRDSFANAGMMHLLTVSGLQIAWLAGWSLLWLRMLRVPRHAAEIGAAVAGLAFAAFLGWPPAATRAASLLALLAVLRCRQRHVRIDALLAASALATLLIDPWSIGKLGFWLSMLGVTGMVVATRWSDRSLGRQWWVRGAAASAGAIIATAPVAAVAFNLVAPIGIVTSIVSLPLMTLLYPALLVSVILHGALAPVSSAFAAWGLLLLRSMVALARLGAVVPNASGGSGTLVDAVPWTLLALGVAWMIHGRTTVREAARRGVWLATATFAIAGVRPHRAVAAQTDVLAFYFANVGQGDGALIRTPGGHWVEVDAGPDEAGQDAGRRVMLPLLRRLGGRRIDLFVLSHAHRDHVGGATALVDALPVDLAIEPGELFADSAYTRWLTALAAHHVRWRAARRGASWTIDSVRFDVLHPPTPWPPEGEDLNEDSIVLLVSYHGFRALLMGDAGFLAESALAGELPRVNLLKVGHHGSRSASGAAFLAAIAPQVAVISVGRHNRYGHPAPETIARLGADGIAVWRTDIDGMVAVTTDGARFDVKGTQRKATFGTVH